jgi:sec-independent protein translocase protein TatA
MFGGIGVQEILVVLIVGLLVFGATRLPKIARSLGLGIKEFKKTIKSVEDDEEEEKSQIRYVQNQPPTYQQQPPYTSTQGQGMQQPGQQGQYYGQNYGQNPPYQQNVQGGYGHPGPQQPPGQGANMNQQSQQQQQQPPQEPPSQQSEEDKKT